MRFLSSICILTFLICSCAGREGRPITTHMAGDDTRSCDSLNYEMQGLRTKINELIPEASKTGKNTALGVGGLIFFPAWFFMDLKNGEKAELKAFNARYNYLINLAQSKKCNLYN